MLVRPKPDGTEKARQDEFTPCDDASTLGHHIDADDADLRAKVEEVPVWVTEDRQAGLRAQKGITFPGQKLEESRFAATIRS